MHDEALQDKEGEAGAAQEPGQLPWPVLGRHDLDLDHRDVDFDHRDVDLDLNVDLDLHVNLNDDGLVAGASHRNTRCNHHGPGTAPGPLACHAARPRLWVTPAAPPS